MLCCVDTSVLCYVVLTQVCCVMLVDTSVLCYVVLTQVCCVMLC